jgi:hypothetical protein
MAKHDDPPTPADQSAIERLADALIARQPVDQNNLGLSKAKIDELTRPPAAQMFRRIAVRHPETGSTFVATIVEARDRARFPHGRITAVDTYREPDGMRKFQRDGGLIPDDMPWHEDRLPLPPIGTPWPETGTAPWFQQLRAEMCRDATRFFLAVAVAGNGVGNSPDKCTSRALTAELCVDGAKALETPWQKSGDWGGAE